MGPVWGACGIQLYPEAHRNSIDRIFLRLGDSGTISEIAELLAKTRA
ncbi:hypothetical protein [Streptomyces sp. NPDC051994]